MVYKLDIHLLVGVYLDTYLPIVALKFYKIMPGLLAKLRHLLNAMKEAEKIAIV